MVESSLLSSLRDTVTCETGLKKPPSYDDFERNLQYRNISMLTPFCRISRMVEEGKRVGVQDRPPTCPPPPHPGQLTE